MGGGRMGGGAVSPVVFPELQVPEALQQEAQARYGSKAGEKEALHWASDLKDWPERVKLRDAERLRQAGTLEALAMDLQAQTRPHRLNKERIDQVCAMVPELVPDLLFQEVRDKLYLIAQEGMRVTTPKAYLANGMPPSMGEKERRMQPAICKLVMKIYDKGYGLLIPLADMNGEQELSGLSLNYLSTGWATKDLKVEGRITIDPSHTTPSSASLNLPHRESQATGRKQYGTHPLPTLRDLVAMIVAAEHTHGGDLTLIKLDLQGAFHLLNFCPDSLRLMCSRLRGDMVLVWLTGNFGHSHTPFAFGVLSKFLELVVNALGVDIDAYRVFGVRIYVDDLMVAVRATEAGRVRTLLEAVIGTLLGDSAVATEKTEVGRRLTLIGWDTDLDARTVTMSRKTLLKAIYFFGLVREGRFIAYRDMEVLAALTERLSGVAPELAGFKSYLYNSFKWRNRHSTLELDDTALVALHLCRAIVVRHLTHMSACYSFDRLVPRRPTWVVEYDGSIYGIGGRLFELVAGREVLRLCISLDMPDEVASHPERDNIQNGCELLAASISAAALLSLGASGAALLLRGDSMVSGSWLSKGHYASHFSKNSSLLWLTLLQSCGFTIELWVHLPKASNTACDDLSRRLRPTLLSCPPAVNSALDRLVALCNPIAPAAHFGSLSLLNSFLADLASNLSLLSPG